MNEQVIDDLYNRAKSQGYSKSKDEFINLLHNNQDVFNDNYSYVKSKGYQKDENQFASLIGKGSAQPTQEVKKKEVPNQPTGSMALPSANTSLESQKPVKEQGWLLNTVSALDKGFYKNLIGSPVKGFGTLLEGVSGGKAPISDALINFGDYFNKAIDEVTPQDEAYKNSLSDQFAQAFGQVASQVATGAVGMLGKAGALASAESVLASQTAKSAPTVGSFVKGAISEIKNPTVVSSGLSMGQSEFDRAKQAGASDGQAFEAFYKNAAVGSVLEKVPVMQFLKRFDKATAHGLTDYLKTKAVHGLTGGIEEMTTEVLQQLYANQTAKDIYNTNQKLFEDVGTSGGVGFGVGFLLNAMGANVKLLKKQGRNEEAKIIENQIHQFENNGGVSTYKFNGIPIEKETMVELINKMDDNALMKARIEVTNDNSLKDLLQDKIITSSTKKQVREGNPNLNEASLDAITKLELELKKIEGNTTQTGKDRAASLKQEIKNIQENPLADKPKQGLPQEIESLQDNEVIYNTVKTLDEVPEQFRGNAEFVEGVQGYTRKKILGLPIGKKESIDGSGYRYGMMGRDIKALASKQLGITNVYNEQFNAEEKSLASRIREFVYSDNEENKNKAFSLYDLVNQEASRKRGGGSFENVAQEYFAAKANGSNPELVKAVEELLGINKTQQNAIQEQGTNEGVLRTGQPEVGLQEVGKGNTQPQGAAAEEGQQTVTNEATQEEVVPESLKDVESTANALASNEDFKKNKIITTADLGNELFKSLNPLRDEYNALIKTPGVEREKAYSEYKQKQAALISEAYHKAKADGGNNKLVNAVEGLLNQQAESAAPKAKQKSKAKPAVAPIAQPAAETVQLAEPIVETVSPTTQVEPVSSKTQEEPIAPTQEQPVVEEDEDIKDVSNYIQDPNLDNSKKRFALSELIDNAKRKISNADDVDAAIEKYNKAVKLKEDFEKDLAKKENDAGRKNRVQDLVDAENENAQRPTYKLKELHAKDPRLAAIASAKNYINITNSEKNITEEEKDLNKKFIKILEDNIADLEADIAENPVAAQEEVQPVEEEEVFEPLTIKGTTHETFTRDNASDYEEDEKEGNNGRTYTYLSSITVPLVDEFTGDEIGSLVKIVDEDGEVSWQAQDVNGIELGDEAFDTKKEAQQAIVDAHNKEKLKEFNEAKKAKQKAKEKKAKADAKKVEAESKKKNKQDEQIQSKRTGNRTRRTKVSQIKPLEGSPSVPGVNGPDTQLVAVAEDYAKENGIPFKRQAEYVKVDEDRAVRIADAYEKMAHDPQNPKVKEAYQNLIKQTIAQYNALVKAGYKFWFMDLNIPSNQDYASSPYNAIRDLRKNKEMGVFPTTDGYGDGGVLELNVDDNPMLVDTGIRWSVGSLNGQKKAVLANDLFRAVHDAFGHGLEGAGFRARGEENAWQAHVRLFTGSAIGAITTETRGQNSWLNFGPHGESNRNAKVEDTIFADQKVGLMPEWTWKEGLAADMEQKSEAEEKTVSSKTQQTAPEVEDLLDLDTKDKDNLDKVFGVLDNLDKKITKRLRGNANDSLLALPLGTAQLVIRGLKVLVRGGMMLRDAIRKVSTENNISQQLVKDIINVAEIQDGFDELMTKVDAMIARQTRRGIPLKRMVSNIDTLVRKSEVYQNATDAQKKILEREARAKTGTSARKAPSIGRILGVLKDINNVSREDKLKIISQIRQLSKDAAKDLAKEIRLLGKAGKISVTQAQNIISRFGKVNMLSEISVAKFVDYMTKVFADAEYNSKLSNSNKIRNELKSLSKDTDRNADLRNLAEKFIEIDPSMVEDIDAYFKMASDITNSLKGSKIKGTNVEFSTIVNIADAVAYTNDQVQKQKEILRQQIIDEFQRLNGVDMSQFSYEDLVGLLDSKKTSGKDESIVRSIANRVFEINAAMIKSMLQDGVDPFTGDPVTYTEEQKRVINNFMQMDLNFLKIKEVLQAVDALTNFIQNKSTAKMASVYRKYIGNRNAQVAVTRGIKAKPIRMYFMPGLGRFAAEQLMNLPTLFNRMFPGRSLSSEVQKLMGITETIQRKAQAQTEANTFVANYVKEFYNKMANGEKFNTMKNMIERGMVSFMMRNVIGTQSQMKAEFNRRYKLIEQSIKVLSEGNEQEQEKAKIYQEVYDKILKDSKNIDDIKGKVDATNLEAVEYWTKKWESLFDKFSDVASNVYNKVLEKELNYNPDNLKKLKTESNPVDIDNDESVFLSNDGMIYTKESNGLMKVTRPDNLPISDLTGRAERYVDLSFDYNNSKSLYDGLVDVYTAEPIRQVQAFLNSDSYKKIVPNNEDATILKNRVTLYIQNIRGKNMYVNVDEMDKMIRFFDELANIGIGQALAGLGQPVKQVIPVAINTLINAQSLDISSAFNPDKNNFMNNSGYAIANRGGASQADIESVNQLIKKASESTLEKAGGFIKELNAFYLKNLLEKPDVFIARMSWMTYYEKSLKQQGIDPKGIDYKTHQVNEKAAQYAQEMVDSQQNISDIDLSGKMFSSKDPKTKLITKTIMPFVSFRMNQYFREANNINSLKNWKSITVEDRKAAITSLAGYSAELATFKLISMGIGLLTAAIASKMRGEKDDEEELRKRWYNAKRGQATSTITEMVNVFPPIDPIVQGGLYYAIDKAQDILKVNEKEKVNIFDFKTTEAIKNFGLYGIPLERGKQLYELITLSNGDSFKNQYNQKRWLNQKDKEALRNWTPMAFASAFGLLPSEFGGIVRNELNGAKKDASSKEGGKSNSEVMEDIEAKQESEYRKEEKEKKEELLGKYKNESDMKRYDRPQWEKKFGEKSEWYKDHKEEMDAERKARAEERKALDEENDYVPSTKKKSYFGVEEKSTGKRKPYFGVESKKKW